jgi:alpha-ketoglutarate-dependent taurine dioxygenase
MEIAAAWIVCAEEAERAEFQYRHKWEVGDLLMWDNALAVKPKSPF